MSTRISRKILCLAMLWLLLAMAALTQAAGQSDLPAILAQAAMQLSQQQYAQAVESFSQAITLDPHDAGAYYGRGTANYSLGKTDLALADLTMAIKLDPGYTYAYMNRAGLYAYLGKYALAVADFSKAIQLAPDGSESYFGRANAYQLLGDTTRAMADRSKAFTLEVYGKDATPPINQASMTGAEKSCVVNFDFDDEAIYVNVRLDGEKKPFCFLLDSGAGIVVLDEKLARKLHSNMLGAMTVTSDAFGATGTSALCLLDSLELGQCRVQHPLCEIIDLQPLRDSIGRQIDGIIGVSFLCNYRVAIDYPRRQLTFSQTAPALSGTYLLKAAKLPEPFVSLNFPISIDGQTLSAVFDTGSNGGLLLPISLLQKLNYAKEEQLGSLGSPNTGIFGESGNSATLLRIKELQIGNFHLQQYPACADRIPEAVLGEDSPVSIYPHPRLSRQCRRADAYRQAKVRT